jgi:uncharacterized protein (TIGR02996 family)
VTTRSDLYQALLANPEDNTLRLVFADWCEEHGESDRAEAIRLQLELDRLSAEDERHSEVQARLWQLQKLHREEWLRELPTLEGITWHLHGGLVEGLCAHSFTILKKHGKKVFQAAPVRRLAFDRFRGGKAWRTGPSWRD